MNKTVILIIIAIALALGLVLAIRTILDKNKELSTITSNLHHVQDSATHWVNKYGVVIADNSNLRGTIKELQQTNQKDLDEASKQLQVKTKQIQGLQKAHAVEHTVFVDRVDTTRRGDTLSSFVHTAPHITVKEFTIGDSAHVEIQDSVDITIAETWHRKWILGSKIYKVQAFTDRDDITITGLSSLTIREQPHHIPLALGIAAGLVSGFFLFHR